jgi:hypothetical protein
LRKTYVVSFCLAILFVIAACTNENENNTKSLSEIAVKAGETEIQYVVKSQDTGSVGSKESVSFESAMSKVDAAVPYVELGETIHIEMKDKKSNAYELLDYILKEDGTLKYKPLPTNTKTIEFDKGKGSFVLNENIWTSLSSQFNDYEPGATIRGFRLINKEDKTKEYTFIVRTDANKRK